MFGTVPASCSLQSAENAYNNVSVTIKMFGTPLPVFSAVYPWHELDSDVNEKAVATRPVHFDEFSPEPIGHLTQKVMISGKTQKILQKDCNPDVNISPGHFQTCLFIRFTPSGEFCDEEPSFNWQATSLMDQMVLNLILYINRKECNYVTDILGLFIEKNKQCTPFKIIAVLQSNVNSSFYCLNVTRINRWLSLWNSSFGRMELSTDTNNQLVNVTHCSAFPLDAGLQKCHIIFFCQNKSTRKDRTVCLVKNHFRKKVGQGQENSRHWDIASDPRLLCDAVFKLSKPTVYA
jgi:hypothetical protein